MAMQPTNTQLESQVQQHRLDLVGRLKMNGISSSLLLDSCDNN